MAYPIHARRHANEQQLSATTLSFAEAVGDVARSLGLMPDKIHQLPRARPLAPQHVAYVWPEPSRHHPHPRGDR